MAKLNGWEREFLERIASAGGFATRKQVGCVTSRAEDKARQACRRRGQVEYQGSAHGALKSGWALTDAGRAALAGERDR